MFDFLSRLIFPVHAVPAAGPLPPRAERLSVRTADHEMIQGIHIPPDEPDATNTLILGFGGNAWNAQDVAEYLHEIYPDHAVVAFHYRGYPPSTGSPSAKMLIADAPFAYDAAVRATRPGRVVGVGFSIGSGVAAELTASRKLDGLILVTPFDSLKGVAKSMFPWLPIDAFFDHEIDAAGPLAGAVLPIAIIAADQDEIVPGEHTGALRKVVTRLVYDRTIERAGHNDIYRRSDFQLAMREALDRLKA